MAPRCTSLRTPRATATTSISSLGEWLLHPVDLAINKRTDWLRALTDAEQFVRQRPADEAGCLYYSHDAEHFVVPEPALSLAQQGVTPHFGKPGGVLPRMLDEPADLP